MYHFGSSSKEKLETCHRDLQLILNAAIKIIDFSVICGHRSEEEQNRYYKLGTSKLQWPLSKHNVLPSLAVDIAPYPITWEGNLARERFYFLQGIIRGIAQEKGISIRQGVDWDRDGDITDQSFNDLPHIELIHA